MKVGLEPTRQQQISAAAFQQTKKPNVKDQHTPTLSKQQPEEQQPFKRPKVQQVISNSFKQPPLVQNIQLANKPIAQQYQPAFYTPVHLSPIASRPAFNYAGARPISFPLLNVQNPYYILSGINSESIYHGQPPLAALPQIPKTSFTCANKPFIPGMYADQETGCKVYHVCVNDRQESFFCGKGTIFNQAILVCDHSSKVACQSSHSYWNANAEFGKLLL